MKKKEKRKENCFTTRYSWSRSPNILMSVKTASFPTILGHQRSPSDKSYCDKLASEAHSSATKSKYAFTSWIYELPS